MGWHHRTWRRVVVKIWIGGRLILSALRCLRPFQLWQYGNYQGLVVSKMNYKITDFFYLIIWIKWRFEHFDHDVSCEYHRYNCQNYQTNYRLNKCNFNDLLVLLYEMYYREHKYICRLILKDLTSIYPVASSQFLHEEHRQIAL